MFLLCWLIIVFMVIVDFLVCLFLIINFFCFFLIGISVLIILIFVWSGLFINLWCIKFFVGCLIG